MIATGVLTSSDRVELIDGQMIEMIVRAANPVDLGRYSEPEPDILLLRPQATEYGQAHLYALNGVSEYWVVDVASERAIVYRRPVNGAYEFVREFGRGGKIAPETFPAIEVAVSDLFD
jgi:hypothetical protein